MHLESSGRTESEVQAAEIEVRRAASRIELTQEELDAIYIRTPDPLSRSRGPVTVRAAAGEADEGMDMPAVSKGEARGKWASYKKEKEKQEEYLLVDGYNIIFAWEDLRKLSETNMAGARGRLADILCNYQGWKKCTLILVFDAYKVEGLSLIHICLINTIPSYCSSEPHILPSVSYTS